MLLELTSEFLISDANNTTRSQKQLWWYYDFLIQIGWTVIGSSDGATGAVDNVDRWGSPFDASKFVWAPDGSPHSWVALQSPAPLGSVYLVLTCDALLDDCVSWYFSHAAPSGGSAWNNPTISGSPIVTYNEAYSAKFRMRGAMDSTGSFVISMGRDRASMCGFISVSMVTDPEKMVVGTIWIPTDTPTLSTFSVVDLSPTLPGTVSVQAAPSTPTYYRMRARDANSETTTYRYWTVADSPDTDGARYDGIFDGDAPALVDVSVVDTFSATPVV